MRTGPRYEAARAYLAKRKRLRGVDAWDFARNRGIYMTEAEELLTKRRLEIGEIKMADLPPDMRRRVIDRDHLDLHAIAAGPIMDSNEIYLPAGKLSMAETRAREAQQILGKA